jgi:oligopeptide transport system permease protein
MTAYIIRRVLWTIPVLWAVATITFFLMHAVPGGPFDRDRPLPPAVQARLNERYDLDKPLLEQYVIYFQKLAQGDLGVSFRNQTPVADLIKDGWVTTVQLGLFAFSFAMVFGVTLGTISALNHNKPLDYFGVFFATVGTALPNFVLGTFLVIIFSVKLGWFDVLGWELGNYKKMVLPILTLGVLPAAFIARITRASLLEVLNQDYIRTARAKGLAERVVIFRHTVKNAMVPVLTVAGPLAAVLVTGSFITESIFQINGIGRRFVLSIFDRDYGLIMGTVLVYATVVIIANLIVDILYAVVDPRIRYS